MQTSTPIQSFIPRIWANSLLASLEQGLMYLEHPERRQEEHERRMATDPAYAKAYELRKAEREAEDYWDALYENWRPEEEEDEW